MFSKSSALWYFVVMLSTAAFAAEQHLPLGALVQTMREGNVVILMRHTSSPRELPAGSANADNVNGERQLDAQGRADAQALGQALTRLDIPVAEVISSPAYRALETAKLAGFIGVTTDELLSNEGMERSNEAHVDRLHTLVQQPATAGNRLIITHGPNITAAFPEQQGLGEGDALVIVPEPDGFRVLAQIRITEWATLPAP